MAGPPPRAHSTNPAFTNPLDAYAHIPQAVARPSPAAASTPARHFLAQYANSYFFADYVDGFIGTSIPLPAW